MTALYYHPFPYSNQLQNHHLYYKHNTLANPLSYHSNAYQSYDHQRNPIIYYNPYQNVSYHYRPDTIKVEVYLAGILCEQAGSGELNDLEIYGNIMANDTLLWNVDSNHHVKMLESNLYPIQVTKQIILDSDQPLRIHGHLYSNHSLYYCEPYITNDRPAGAAVSGIITAIDSAGSAVEKVQNTLKGFNKPRSVVLEIDNNTDLTFTKSSEQHLYGDWAAMPPDKVPPKTAVVFGSQSPGSSSIRGTEGWMWFTAPGLAIRIYWENPMWGTKKCDVEIYGEDADKYRIDKNCSSNDIGALLRYEIYPR